MFKLRIKLYSIQTFRKNSLYMNALKNKVQLIGYVGNNPEVSELKSGKKKAKFSMATNESYTNSEGELITDTQWHYVVAWEKLAQIVEKYVRKGKEIAVEGKLHTRSYEDVKGERKFITEVKCSEVLLLGKPLEKELIEE